MRRFGYNQNSPSFNFVILKKTNFLKFSLFVIFVIQIFGSQGLFAQKQVFDSFSKAYNIEIWDNSQGLPQNAVLALEKDNHGYLWMATEEGLVRMDGSNPKLFDQETNPLMKEQTYYYFFKSKSGIWAAANRSIVLLDKTIVRRIDCDQVLQKTWIKSIAETENQELIIGTLDGKIITWKNEEFSTLTWWNPPLPIEILTIFPVQNEKLLVGTTKGLYELDLKSKTFKLITNESWVVPKIFGTSNSIHFSVQNLGIFHLKELGQLEMVLSYQEHKDIDQGSLIADEQNKILAGTIDDGFLVLEEGRISRFSYPELKNYTIRKIIKEEEAIYLGTLGKGLAIIKEPKVRQLDFDALREKTIKAIYQSPDSSIWIGTRTDGLHRIKNQSILSLDTKDGLVQNGINTIGEFKGKIYAGSSRGISVIDSKSAKVIDTLSVEDGLKSNYVQVIFEDSKGWLWILTRYGGMHYLDEHGVFHSVELPETNLSTSFISLTELKNQQLLIGSMTGEVFRIDNGKVIQTLTLPLSKGEEIIYDIQEDQNGDLWFATHGGVVLFSNGKYHSLKKRNGLKSQSIYSITADPVDGLWMSHNAGVQYFSNAELAYFKASPNTDLFLASTLYNKKLGLPNSETNGLIFPAAIQDLEGKIWVPTVSGVGIIDPLAISKSEKTPLNFVWDELQYGNQVAQITDEIRIPKGIRMFQISFSLIDFDNPSKYSLFYRIDKKSGPWTPIKDQHSINFNGLAPGKYNLELIILRYGKEESRKTIPIIVESSFFETPLFWLIIAATFILLVYFSFQSYFNNRLKNELEAKVALRTLELSQANEKLTAAVGEIEDQNALLKEITWNQSHLVRAPLTKAIGINQLLIKYSTYSKVGKSKEQLESELLETLRQLDQIVKETHSISEKLKKNED